MFGEWNEWVAKYSPVIIIGTLLLFIIMSSLSWYRWKYHLRKKKWLLISLIAVLLIGSGYYYHFVYNTPTKRIERLLKEYEENKRILNTIDEATKHIETEEFQKEMEEIKKRMEVARVKNENAIPWISYGFYLALFIYGCIFLFLWLRDNRKVIEK